jgi:aminoglycoside 6-adenylyltransferase
VTTSPTRLVYYVGGSFALTLADVADAAGESDRPFQVSSTRTA